MANELDMLIQAADGLRDGEGALSGTTPLGLKLGFLCVISLLSTLRKPCVTASPLFNSAKTAAAPPPEALGTGAATAGGGGGRGGAPPAAGPGLYWAKGTPCNAIVNGRIQVVG